MALSPIPHALGFSGSGLEFKVEIAIGLGSEDTGVWDAAEWDDGLWSDVGTGPGSLYWVDVTDRALSAVVSSGRDKFESRFRTGSAIFLLDNDDGVFTPDGGLPGIGDLRFRPGRWIRLLGRPTSDPSPGEFVFPAPPVDTDYLLSDNTEHWIDGFTVFGTLTPAVANPASSGHIVGNWGSAASRSWSLVRLTNGRLRFRIQTITGGVYAVDSPAPGLLPDVQAAFSVTWLPGVEISLTVDGITTTTAAPEIDLETAGQPITVATQSNQSGGLSFEGSIESLDAVPVTGTRLRLHGIDVGTNGPLFGVIWTDPYGTTWEGFGLPRLVGFAPAPSFTPLWTGYISAIADEYGPAGGSIRSRIQASDHLGNLAINNPPALAQAVPAELSSDRVNRILDLSGWPAGARISDVGIFDVQSSFLAQSRLEEIQLTAESEGGAFYQEKAGRTRFRNRDYLNADAGTPSDALLPAGFRFDDLTVGAGETVVNGDAIVLNYQVPSRSAAPQFSIGQVGSGVQVLSAKSDWSTERVYNSITFARSGGDAVTRTDQQSISMYQQRTSGRNNLQNTNDLDVAFLADRFIDRFRFDKLRIEQLTVTAVDDDGASDLLGMELADRIQVTVRNLQGWAFTLDCWINRFTWRISADDWEVDLIVDNVDISDPFDRSGFDDGFDSGFGI